MESLKDVFVAGNPLITRRVDLYGQSGKGAEEDAQLIVIDAQTAAVSAVFKLIQQRVQSLLREKFPENFLANIIIADGPAISAIAKQGDADARLALQFRLDSSRSLDDTGDLLPRISDELRLIKKDIAVVLQLDQSGSLHHYLVDEAAAEIGELLKARGLVYDARDERTVVENINNLIKRLGWPEPQTIDQLNDSVEK